jgi:hypothetical protein
MMKIGSRKIKLLVIAVVLLTSAVPSMAQTYYDGVRIGWEYARETFCTSGGYARIKKLQNGNLAMVFDYGPGVCFCISNDGGRSWGKQINVAHDVKNIYDYTNAELIQLRNGTLMYAWNARPKNEKHPAGPYKIMAKFSSDNGTTWKNEKTLFNAGTAFDEGCWEPSMVQLPSGELQLFFSNEYLVKNNNQNISMMRSFNNGTTWKKHEVISFRNGSRDGMPVPLLLHGGKDLVFSIEDNGLKGTFKPVIVHTSLADNWRSGTVTGTSNKRWPALCPEEDLAADIYAGAPYLIQLSSGETILSVQSGEGRETPSVLDHALMQVYVGDSTAHGFKCKSTPFPFVGNGATNVLWNALCQIDDSTVMATSYISGLPKDNGVWTVTGRIMKPLRAVKLKRGETWGEDKSSLFIGGSSQANVTVKSMWDNDSLYFHFEVKDHDIEASPIGGAPCDADGIEIFLDPQKHASATLVSGLYKFLVNVAGVTSCYYSDADIWKSFSPKFAFSVKRGVSQDYTVEIAIPWSSIGGKPATDDFAAMFTLHNNDGVSPIVHENLSGANPDKPMTWMRVKMDKVGGSSSMLHSSGD